MTARATIYISPPIAAVLDAVPGQSISGRLADVCARYLRMVEDISTAQRIAMLEQFERDEAKRNSKAG